MSLFCFFGALVRFWSGLITGFSLSHTHTHTHTRANSRTQKERTKCGYFCSSSIYFYSQQKVNKTHLYAFRKAEFKMWDYLNIAVEVNVTCQSLHRTHCGGKAGERDHIWSIRPCRRDKVWNERWKTEIRTQKSMNHGRNVYWSLFAEKACSKNQTVSILFAIVFGSFNNLFSLNIPPGDVFFK